MLPALEVAHLETYNMSIINKDQPKTLEVLKQSRK